MSVALYRASAQTSAGATEEEDAVQTWCILLTVLLATLGAGIFLGLRWGWAAHRCPWCPWRGGPQPRMEDLVKAVQQLQALVHAEGYATRHAGAEALHQLLEALGTDGPLASVCSDGFVDGGRRLQAIMNKLMKVGEVANTVHAMHANLGNTLASHQLELQRTVQRAKDDLKQAFAKVGPKLDSTDQTSISDALKAIASAIEEAKLNTSSALDAVAKKMAKDYGDLQRFLTPLQRNQESFGTGMNGRFEQLQKDVSGISYALSKQIKDLSGQLRWAQQSLDRIQGDSEHLPDKLNFLRGLLESAKEHLEAVHKEIEAMGAEQASHSPTAEPAATPPVAPPAASPATSVPGPTIPGGHGPTMLNLDESLPVVSRSGQSYLCPITLPDGKVIFIPKAVLAQMLGAHVL